jgi:hypothetical protein
MTAKLSEYLRRAGWHWSEKPNQITEEIGGEGKESNLPAQKTLAKSRHLMNEPTKNFTLVVTVW